MRPWSFIDDDMAVALVSENCSISHEVVGSAGAFPEVRQVVLTVPIDVDATAADSEFRAAACEDVVVHVRDRAPWLYLAPSDWLCEQLVYDAARVHREHFVGVPAYVTAGRPLGSEALDERLDYHALTRRRGLIVPADRVDAPANPS